MMRSATFELGGDVSLVPHMMTVLGKMQGVRAQLAGATLTATLTDDIWPDSRLDTNVANVVLEHCPAAVRT